MSETNSKTIALNVRLKPSESLGRIIEIGQREGHDPLTMRGIEPNGHEALTLLELVLQLHGDFRSRLAPLRVTPLQAGVLLYLQRHGEAKLKDAAAAVRVQSPTLAGVVNDLVRKRWVTRQRVPHDDRSLCLRLSRQGVVLVREITDRISDMTSALKVKEET